MIIRKAKIEDLNELVGLDYKNIIFHDDLNGDPPTMEEIEEYDFERLKNFVNNPYSFAYVIEDTEFDKLVGFAYGDIFEPVIKICSLFILEEYRGRGLGGDLLEVCEDITKDTTLMCAIKNENALKFYEKHGYTILETHFSEKNYVMVKEGMI